MQVSSSLSWQNLASDEGTPSLKVYGINGLVTAPSGDRPIILTSLSWAGWRIFQLRLILLSFGSLAPGLTKALASS